MPDRSGLSSVARALRVLRLLEQTPSISVTEVATLLDVAPSSAHRLLTTLRDSGFVRQQAGSRRYAAGSALVDIALGALAHMNLRQVASGHLELLSRQLRTSTWLVMSEDSHVFSSDTHVPDREPWSDPSMVPRSLVHTLASGKLFLANRTRKQLDQLFPGPLLPTATPQSIRTKDRLVIELDLIRKHRFAVQVGEAVTAVAAIAVPVCSPAGDVVAAIAVTGRTTDFDASVRRHHVELANRSAADITRAMALGAGSPPA